jgi:hypothetical protein
MRNLEKCPECLQRFHVEWQGKSSRKRNFFDFESPDSAISRFSMTTQVPKFWYSASIFLMVLWLTDAVLEIIGQPQPDFVFSLLSPLAIIIRISICRFSVKYIVLEVSTLTT